MCFIFSPYPFVALFLQSFRMRCGVLVLLLPFSCDFSLTVAWSGYLLKALVSGLKGKEIYTFFCNFLWLRTVGRKSLNSYLGVFLRCKAPKNASGLCVCLVWGFFFCPPYKFQGQTRFLMLGWFLGGFFATRVYFPFWNLPFFSHIWVSREWLEKTSKG